MVLPLSPHWLVTSVGLFFLTFAHEDVAIVAGAAAITELDAPWTAVAASLWLGVVASDFAIFGLGRLATKMPRVRARLITPRVYQAQQWLSEHLTLAVVVCHLIPGLLFPTFVASGWFGIPWRRFAPASMAMAAVYVGVMLTVWHRLGAAVHDRLDAWSWAVAGVVILSVTAIMAGRPHWETLSAAASNLNALRNQTMTVWRRNVATATHKGMPALGRLVRHVARGEYLPAGLFYIPLILQWLLLSVRYRSLTLPTAADPFIKNGGFWGESKSACMDFIAGAERKWLADYFIFQPGESETESIEAFCARAHAALAAAHFSLPVVAKPDIGWQGYGVRLLETDEDLKAYLAAFPSAGQVIFQKYVPYDGEAGVLYVRLPGASRGEITSLTLRYFPYVTGDGVSTVAHLIMRDTRASFKASFHLGIDPHHLGLTEAELKRIPAKNEIVRLAFIGSIRVGGLYIDASTHISEKLVRRFDDICRSMPEFYYGRFDIRFRSLEALEDAEDFAIIEINGTGSEPLHAWDPELSLAKAYAILLRQQRLLFRVAALNRARGFKPASLSRFWADYRRQQRLIESYPPSS